MNLTSLISGGPELPAAKKPALMEQTAANPQIHWFDYTDDLANCMVAADVVVSMGGYNTICEILSLGKRAIVVPHTEPVQEQWIRAERMTLPPELTNGLWHDHEQIHDEEHRHRHSQNQGFRDAHWHLHFHYTP